MMKAIFKETPPISHARIMAIIPRFVEEEPEPGIDPLAAIAALREYFQEVQVCGVHTVIKERLDALEKDVKFIEHGEDIPQEETK
jgi:predicted sugar kinase